MSGDNPNPCRWTCFRGLLAGATLILAIGVGPAGATDRIVVASKNFEENRLLGEMFAQLLETRLRQEGSTAVVERRLGLAGSDFCFRALLEGSVDVYPEYTGTAWLSILKGRPLASRAATLAAVRQNLRLQGVVTLPPLGFENAYEVAVTGPTARRHALVTISDLARIAPELRAGFGYEFVGRPDGFPGLAERYGLRFAAVQSMQQAPKVQAAVAGAIDVLDVYTTDGHIARHGFVVLTDDLEFFPPYQAVPLLREATQRHWPTVATALSELAGLLDETTMRRLNLAIQQGAPETAIAHQTLADLGLIEPDSRGSELGDSGIDESRAAGGGRAATSSRAANIQGRETLAQFWRRTRGQIARLTTQHLALSASALALGILVALPLALALERLPRFAEGILRVFATTQTIPSLALLGFLIPLLGVGTRPALFALWLYTLFPILRGAYSGLRDADPRAVEAGRACGMSPRQQLLWVRLPLALSPILAGVRTAAVITIGTATLAAFIGAGGLGELIISGVQLVDGRRILAGAIPAALLAILVDSLLGAGERHLLPRGLRLGP